MKCIILHTCLHRTLREGLSERDALLLLLGPVMHENGGSKSTTADLLHDLVLIHADRESIPRMHPESQLKRRKQKKRRSLLQPINLFVELSNHFPSKQHQNDSLFGGPTTIATHSENRMAGFAEATNNGLSELLRPNARILPFN